MEAEEEVQTPTLSCHLAGATPQVGCKQSDTRSFNVGEEEEVQGVQLMGLGVWSSSVSTRRWPSLKPDRHRRFLCEC